MSTRDQQSQEPEKRTKSGQQEEGILSSSEKARQGMEEALKGEKGQEQEGGILSSSEKARQGTKEDLEREAENRPGSEQQKQ